MRKINPSNERVKHKYFIFLKDAKQLSETSIDGVAKALARFEEYTQYKDFKTFRHEQASGFKKYLSSSIKTADSKPLSKATLRSTYANIKCFFQWLAREPGYKSKIAYSDAEYFNSSLKDLQIATAKRIKKVPTLEQIKHVINTMPDSTEIERRNKALLAFTILTGARDSAIASAKLGHINLVENCFYQDAREVKTKFSKTFPTYFFPVGDEIKQIVIDWIEYLKFQKLYSDHDPLFPTSEIGINEQQKFSVIGIKPDHWSSASPVREIFKQAFNQAGLEYFNPHSFRDTLVKLGQTRCKTPEAFKAWSQNLGHESVLTTLYSYGEVGRQRQAEIMNTISIITDDSKESVSELSKIVAKALVEYGVKA
jgi:integrase/recombinase XerD